MDPIRVKLIRFSISHFRRTPTETQCFELFDEQYNLRDSKLSPCSSSFSYVHRQTYVATVFGSALSFLQEQGPPQYHFRARLARVFVAGMVRNQPSVPTAPRRFRVLTAQIPAARPVASSSHRSRSVRRTDTFLPSPPQRRGRSRIQNPRNWTPRFLFQVLEVVEDVVARGMKLARQHKSLWQ